MKLRVRRGQRTERIELLDDHERTLKGLSTKAATVLGLEEGSFELTLNGRDPINGSPEDSLASFGIVSGDLVKVLVPGEDGTSVRESGGGGASSEGSGSKRETRRCTRINGSMNLIAERNSADESRGASGSRGVSSKEGGRPSGGAGVISSQADGSNNNQAENGSEMSQEEREAREELARLDEEAAEAENISEPMLCRDAEGQKIPLRLRQLCQEVCPQSSADAVCLVLHVLMLEAGFHAPSQDDLTTSSKPSSSTISEEGEESQMGNPCPDPLVTLPKGWKKGSSYKIQYQHSECTGSSCTLAVVSMGGTLLVHGLIQKNIQATLQYKPNVYASLSQGDVSFANLAQLSRTFKDGIVYPLLAAMREDLGLPPLHGLLALFPEIQLKILSFLDVTNLLAMSAVCQHFSVLSKDTSLWRQLVLRDFGGRATDKQCDWRGVYKERYRLKKVREQLRARIQNSFYPPGRRPFAFVPPVPNPLPGIYPPGFRGGGYDLDPFRSGGALPGYPAGFNPIAGPVVPNPRFDPIFPNPDSDLRPGHGGGLRDLDPNRPHPYAPHGPQLPPMMPGRRGGRGAGGGGWRPGLFR